MRASRRRLLQLIVALHLLLLGAALVYRVGMAHLEGQPRTFWESLAWAGETVTTTGYGADARWQHPAMVLFVVGLQLVGVILIYIVLPVYLIALLEERFEARLPRQVRKLRNHVLIYRYGPAVENLLEELTGAGLSAVVIEHDDTTARGLIEQGVRVVYVPLPSAALEHVCLTSASALIANGSDEENTAITLAARQLDFQGEILALVEEPTHRPPLLLAGADAVFTPRHLLGATLAARASHRISPRVGGIQQLGRSLQLSEIRIAPDSPLAGSTLAEAAIGAHTDTTVIGQWIGGQLKTLPDASTRLVGRGILVALGTAEGLRKLADLAGDAGHLHRDGPLLVAGFGEVGRKVVELLRQVDEAVTVIDRKKSDGVDFVGDVLDHGVLKAADLTRARAVLLALDADSATLFATVIIRDMAPEVPIVARVNNAANVERIHHAGADFALSISQVSGQMLAHRLLGRQEVAIEPQLRVLEVSSRGLEGRHPADLDIRARTGCSVVAVERGDHLLVTFPPDFTFASDDAVFICGSGAATERYLQRYGEDRNNKH